MILLSGSGASTACASTAGNVGGAGGLGACGPVQRGDDGPLPYHLKGRQLAYPTVHRVLWGAALSVSFVFAVHPEWKCGNPFFDQMRRPRADCICMRPYSAVQILVW